MDPDTIEYFLKDLEEDEDDEEDDGKGNYDPLN